MKKIIAVILCLAVSFNAWAIDPKAKRIQTDTSSFNNNLSGADDDVQKALDTLDNMTTGGVTSVSNSDGTLTISPTTGAVVASLNLGSPNDWTGQQTFSNATYSALFTGGNVGIGTSAPNNKLSILSSGEGTLFGLGANGAQDLLTMGYIGGTTYIHGSTYGPIQIRSQGNHNIRITPAGTGNTLFETGNVGIGTASPLYKLEVAGIAYTTQLQLPNTTSSILGGIYFGGARAIHNTGTDNLFAGGGSGNLTTSGFGGNTGVGASSLSAISTGYANTAIGTLTIPFVSTGIGNTAIGYTALYSNTANYGTAFGMEASYNNTSGAGNTGVGYRALYFNSTGASNTAVGYGAGNGTGSNSYSNNSLFGYQSGLALTTGSNNILFGYRAGDNLTTGANNIVLGYNIDSPTASNSNTLNIGNLIFATGLDGSGTTLSTGKVGIGTTSPSQKLTVESSGEIQMYLGTTGTFGWTFGRNTGTGDMDILSNQGIGSLNVNSGAKFTGAVYVGANALIQNNANNITLGGTFRASGGDFRLGANGTGYNFIRNPATGILQITGEQTGYTGINISMGNKADAFTITDTGNVGIGTTTPGAKLQVDTTAAVVGTIIKGATSQTADLTQWQNSAGTVLAVIDENGRFGFGTDTPTVPVDILSNIQSGLKIRRTDATAASYEFYVSTDGSFNYYDNTTAFNRMVLTNAGLLTIGTQALALAQLGVVNSISTNKVLTLRAASGQSAQILNVQNSSGNQIGFRLRADGVIDTGTERSNTVYNGTNTAVVNIQGPDGYWGIRTNTSNAFNLDVYNSGAQLAALTVLQSGNVGIGSTTVSAKLHVTSATEQLRAGYDASNYFSTTVGSTGGVTFDAIGSGAEFAFADKIVAGASTTTRASLNMPSGTAPTAPVDGDIWSDGSNVLVRLGGTTYTLTKT